MKNTYEYISNFKHQDTQIFLTDFLSRQITFSGSLINSQIKFEIISALALDLNLQNITWRWAQNTFDSFIDLSHKQGFVILVSRLLDNGYYTGDYIEIVNSFTDDKNVFINLFYLLENKLAPPNLLIARIPQRRKNSNKQYSIVAYKTDIKSIFLYNLLVELIDSNPKSCAACKDFFNTFQESLGEFNVTKIDDFNIDIFNNQYWFYKNKPGATSREIAILKSFYMMLMNKEEGKNILTLKDGIDYYMLQSFSFDYNYENGFKLVLLNHFDPIPSFDKWLVVPNGAEKNSTKIKEYQYKPLDFSVVQDDVLKWCVKHWFWNNSQALSSRLDSCSMIIKFINFIYDLRNKHNLNQLVSNPNKNGFAIEEVFSYVQYIKSNGFNNSYIYIVKTFLEYLSVNNLYIVPPDAYKYFTTKSSVSVNQAEDLSDDDLILLEKKLKENCGSNFQNTLYYIVFHIALSTEMRISQILSLKVDCLKKGANNIHYLESITKVSKGQKVQTAITPNTRRFIETAIQFTQEIRDNCLDLNLKKYVFLHNTFKNKYMVLDKRSFSDYLKNTCVEINIKPYTAKNLRYTYMTKAIEFAIKNDKSLLEIKSLTSHKKIDTTNNHYVAHKIREYLEATYMVQIGDVDLKGSIIMNRTENTIPENLVNDQCGYCSEKTCNLLNGLDCLMCKGFIATLDRIPYFENKILQIDTDIINSDLQHDKEHVLVIKRLYLAYLEKLYILKEECV